MKLNELMNCVSQRAEEAGKREKEKGRTRSEGGHLALVDQVLS